jgi:predicted DNA-binding transcriptional regulator YafY
MAKQDYLLRYLTIIKKLRKSSEATFEEIRVYLEQESELQDRPFSISNRTFQRDLNEIHSLFRIDIQYNFSSRKYAIIDDQQSDINNRLLESLDTINSLKMVSDVSKYMFFEKRVAKGTHHFAGLLNAIKNRSVIKLTHQRYESDEPTQRLIEPLGLKESRGRWYLLAKDTNDKRLKTFGLDRILDFESTSTRFDYPKDLDINEKFRYSFGVINPDDEMPEEIILSFKSEQGKYIKSYPLHESQVIIQDDEAGLRIKLNLCITHDLVMEILSYGETVEIIAPQKLRDQVRSIYQNALNIYN